MKAKFLKNVLTLNNILIYAGEEFEAREDGDYIMIRMKDDSTLMAPKYDIGLYYEVVK
jgi:hypothetical protein